MGESVDADTTEGLPEESPVLERAKLGQLSRIAAGGQGTTYNAPGVHLGFAQSVVYKEYKDGVLAALDTDQLARMPKFLLRQPGSVALKLVSICAWPCAMVSDGDRMTGFVMPRIPDRFWIEMTTVRGVQRRTAEFQHLLNSPEYLEQRGIPLSVGDRYRLIEALARELMFLHSLGIAVGDMSPKNMMFSLHPAPAVYFIDTDAMRLGGRSVSEQMESPGWAVPAGEDKATAFSDRYKLGLLALRLLVGDHEASEPHSLPTHAAPSVVALIRRTLTATPAERPAPSAWIPKANAAAEAADVASQAAARTTPIAVKPRAPVRTAGSNPSPSPASSTPHRAAQQPAVPLRQRKRSRAGVITLAVFVALMGLLVAAVAITNRTSNDSSAAPVTTTAYRVTTTADSYPTETTTTTMTTTVARTSAAPPASTTACPSGVYYVNSVTTCGFASNVYLAMEWDELPKTYTNLSSPSRPDRTFDMYCHYVSTTSKLVLCEGGDNAQVYIP